MKFRIKEHLLTICFVALTLFMIATLLNSFSAPVKTRHSDNITKFVKMKLIDSSDPFQKELMANLLNIYYPEQKKKNRKIVKEFSKYQENLFLEELGGESGREELSISKFVKIIFIYLKFIFVYIIVLILTYYGVLTIGAYKFVRERRALGNSTKFIDIIKSVAEALFSLLLFSPAYVIAYAIKTEFNTDTLFFMTVLAVISNGLLLMYSSRFYNTLLIESRKGYVETAIVKNLNNSYSKIDSKGIKDRQLFSFSKNFTNHVFGHIFSNAKHQYLSIVKEQASFLISGLIIIEMALNIHGHLCYELLTQILNRSYTITALIIFLIFITVKFTEIFIDFLLYKRAIKHGE